MTRSRAILLGLLVGCVPVSVATGLGGASPMVLALLVLVAASIGGAIARRRRPVESGWTPPAGAPAFVPAAARGDGRGGVTAALGRVESRRVLDSVAFWTGISFSAMSIWLFGWEWANDSGGDIGRIAVLSPWLAQPLVGMLLIAAHRARTRARRDGASELFASCPVSDHRRDLGHLASAWVGAIAAMLTSAGVLVAFRLRVDVVWGTFGIRETSYVLGCALLAVGATALGVLLARVAPWTISPVVAIVAIGALSLSLPGWGGGAGNGLGQLSTMPAVEGYDWLDSRFYTPRWLAHQAWIAALVAVVMAMVVAIGSRRRTHMVALGCTVALAAGAAWAATRPTAAAERDRVASLIADPERHQTCVDLGVELCTYRGDEVLVGAYRPHVAAVLDALPSGATVDDLSFRQGADVRLSDLDDSIAERLGDWHLPRRVAPVKLTTEGYSAARFWLALAATEIADETRHGHVVDLRGQARGVVAIWLATRGLPRQEATEEMASLPPDTDHGQDWYGSRPWPDACLAGPTPVVWAHTDLAAARTLIGSPEEQVTAIVQTRWNDWLDPAATTDELLDALGHPGQGEPLGETPVVGSC